MIHITTESVERAFIELLDEFGEDHVYPRHSQLPYCRYAIEEDGAPQPDCIVGHVLVKHGLDPALLVYGPGRGEYSFGSASRVLDNLERAGLAKSSMLVQRALDRAQLLQDSRSTWGESVKAAMLVLDRE